jgi:hypothetical protein
VFLWASLGLSLFSWSLDLGIHFFHFTLNPVLFYFLGGELFPSLFFFPYFCFYPWTVYNLVLAGLQY